MPDPVTGALAPAARLLHRTTRSMRLTKAGTRYLEDCRRILFQIDDAEETAAGSHREP